MDARCSYEELPSSDEVQYLAETSATYQGSTALIQTIRTLSTRTEIVTSGPQLAQCGPFKDNELTVVEHHTSTNYSYSPRLAVETSVSPATTWDEIGTTGTRSLVTLDADHSALTAMCAPITVWDEDNYPRRVTPPLLKRRTLHPWLGKMTLQSSLVLWFYSNRTWLLYSKTNLNVGRSAFYPNTPFGLPAPDDMKVDTAGSTELVPPEYAPPLPALSNADLAYLEIESMAPGDMDSEVTETNALIVSEDPRFSAHILTLRETTRIQGDAQSSLAQVADDNQLATNELRVVTARELRSLSEAAHSSSELYRQLESRLSIVQQDIRLSNESLALRRVFTKHDRQSQARLDKSFRRLAEQTEANKCLNDLVADQSSLVGRVQSLDSRLEEEGFKRESSSPKSKPADKPPPVSSAAFPSNDFYRLLLTLQETMCKMESDMADVRETVETSSHGQAFGHAVKYTTTPTSDEQGHCEFFMKQLVDQADRSKLTDDERKSLLGLKLTSDKVHPSLNRWWISYSKTKSSNVLQNIYDDFMDQFCNRTPRELVGEFFEESERYDGETVKDYFISLQKILDDMDIPPEQGVVIFRRGVRQSRAEPCLEITNKELRSISDCMKLIRTRQIPVDGTTSYRDRPGLKPSSRPSSSVSTAASSRFGNSERSPVSSLGFDEKSDIAKLVEALTTNQQQQQQTFVAQIAEVQKSLIEALCPPQPLYTAPI
ncbi:unnamed protein product [Aphanomyces euteiches]